MAGHQSPLHALSPAHCPPPPPARNTPTLAEYSSDVSGLGSSSTAEAREGLAAIDCCAQTAIAMAIGTAASQHNSIFPWGGPKPCVWFQSAHQLRESTHPFRRRGANHRRQPMGSPTHSNRISVGLWEARASTRHCQAQASLHCCTGLGEGCLDWVRCHACVNEVPAHARCHGGAHALGHEPSDVNPKVYFTTKETKALYTMMFNGTGECPSLALASRFAHGRSPADNSQALAARWAGTSSRAGPMPVPVLRASRQAPQTSRNLPPCPCSHTATLPYTAYGLMEQKPAEGPAASMPIACASGCAPGTGSGSSMHACLPTLGTRQWQRWRMACLPWVRGGRQQHISPIGPITIGMRGAGLCTQALRPVHSLRPAHATGSQVQLS